MARSSGQLPATGLIAATPLAILAVLAAMGALAWQAALPAAAAALVGSAVLATLWIRDLRHPTGGIGRDADQTAPIADPADAASDRVILDALPDPLLVLAADRSLRYANDAARIVLGSELGALLRHPTLRGAIDRAQAESRKIESIDLLLPVPVPRDLHAVVIDLGPTQPAARTALLLADRTRARAVERMRADFVANASHELRTPLASLIGFIDTLRGPAADDPDAQSRFLAIMAEQAQRMNRLIDDLLSLSRIELSEHLAPATRVDLAALVARALSSLEPRRAQAGAELRTRMQPNLPLVPADEDQIEQVLQNLLDNALKYGRPGAPIEVSLQEATGGRWPKRPGVVLAVKDEGSGIPRAHLPRLTERFYRVDRGRSRAAGGTGLGLAIVKHIVNRHRGQLAIDSEEGIGSTFSIWLPLAG